MTHTFSERASSRVHIYAALASGFLLIATQPARAADQFAGFPAIGKTNPGKKSTRVIASDPVEGLLRPKWTRAFADLGSGVNLFRYKGDLYFVHGAGDGHRGAAPELKDKRFIYVSKDEGRTWTLRPQPEGAMFSKYLRPVGDKLFDFWFDEGQTVVQTSEDGLTFTPKQKVYQPPYWLYEVNYDPVTELFWCAAQSMAVGKKPDGSWLLRDVHLVKSKDCIHWEHVSTLPVEHVNISEADLRFEPDRTMAVIVRRKWSGDYCTLAVAKPPYTQWELSSRPEVAEGHSFLEAGGAVFMGSRAYYRDDIPEIRENPSLRYATPDGVAYTVIHRFTPPPERKFVAWAVVDSMGDCSYPRLVETPTEILVAYYSEHEDNVCKPYLAAFDKEKFLAPLSSQPPDFAGFPAIGQRTPGKPSAERITSDAAPGDVRPKWTRAMSDLGHGANLFRFKGDLYYLHTRDAGTTCLVSADEGRTWKPASLSADLRATDSVVPLNDTLFRYDFDGTRTTVQSSPDGRTWTESAEAYRPSFRLHAPIYDPASKLSWCAANVVPGNPPIDREVHLINSPDGIRWNYVSTIITSGVPNAGEAALIFDADRNLLIAVRSNTPSSHFFAWAAPPYKDWKLSELGDIAEFPCFFAIGGRTFLTSRANYRGDDEAIQKTPPLFDGRASHAAIYRLAKSHEALAWAVPPSMGACSSPRLVETPTEILCAYDSQHQDGVSKPFLAAFDKREVLRRR